ncbi:hypothetical protein ABWH74_002703 [Burkholderia vietnamiensis]|uniref:hypothetical protein n=1 Tax=Burkholderia vietnamiensis TaxID=60552 RepID=UPI0015940B16|nr:hypothetical protein [Burkholderia vietnamiensis]WHU92232.1 hypothetical protein P4G95_00205 [Burkholderia vietnamiensis]
MSTSQTSVGPIWWEKTVEYLYVARQMAQYTVIAPLAGKQEAAADVMLRGLNARWNLIEFKRSEAEIRSELLKYDRTNEIFRTLAAVLGIGKKGVPHFIVYGCCDELGELDLRARHYWGSWTGVESVADRCVAVEAIPESGWVYDEFVKYLKALLSVKSKTTSTSTRSLQFDSVIGIVGDRCSTMSLSDFIDFTPRLAHRIELEPPAPSSAMPKPEADWALEP